MSRSRPASNPISYHKHTKQYYITRGGRRIYLGSDKNQAMVKYHQLGLCVESVQREMAPPVNITAKNLANRKCEPDVEYRVKRVLYIGKLH